jgi:omega-6 fatty acid desaturase (delta-12 desaturase)
LPSDPDPALPSTPSGPTGRAGADYYRDLLKPYWGADTRRSVAQLLTSALPFFALWYAMLRSLEVGYWLTLLLAVPTAGFLMRLFMIQHDCGHGSFFRSRTARDLVGFCIGVLTLVPYQYWRRTHAYHHAHSGNLDFRGFGDIDTLTVREYLALPPLRRLAYRAYRNPFVIFGIGPAFHFLVKHRYPWDVPRDWREAWRSVWRTNAAIVAIVLIMAFTVGIERFLLVQLPLTLLTCSLGVWLFYVQHQYEETYWHRRDRWDFFDAALQGSSHLVLPRPLQWLTANIGLHHVHHLSSRIPNYRLQEVLDAHSELANVTRITLRDSLRLATLSLWDEDRSRLIRFRDLPRDPATAA